MPTTDTIIAELVELDPTLAGREAELRQLVAKLQQAQPDGVLDPDFRAKLREHLLDELGHEQQTSSFFSFMTNPMKYMSYGALGAAAVAVPAVALVYTQLAAEPLGIAAPASRIAAVPAGVQITQLSENAFGSLAESSGAGGLGGSEGGTHSIRAMAVDEGMADADMAVPEVATLDIAETDEAETAAPSVELKIANEPVTTSMPAPAEYIPTIYRYRYSGALPTLSSEVQVLRSEPQEITLDGVNILARMGLGLFDESALRDTTVQNLSIVEDREYGYQISVDTEEGTVSVNKNWETWPNLHQGCDTPACWESLRLTENDILADSELIHIADAWVRDMDIDLSAYGEPQVGSQWRDQLARVANPAEIWIPDELQVTYPLLVEGKETHEAWGNPHGLVVNIDAREERVSGLWNLRIHNYSASMYETVGNERLRQAIADGDTHPAWQPEGRYNEINIELDTPTEVWLPRWHWDDSNSTNSQLLVPALHFPIVSLPSTVEPWFSRDAVVIPLAAELYTEPDVRILPMPEPLPLDIDTQE